MPCAANCRQRPAEDELGDVVHITTSDGEWFPVKRRLLRPAIALTRVVRSEEAHPSATIDVDTLTFDR